MVIYSNFSVNFSTADLHRRPQNHSPQCSYNYNCNPTVYCGCGSICWLGVTTDWVLGHDCYLEVIIGVTISLSISSWSRSDRS